MLLCEAPTGTGKTLAYLLPAVESGLRVVVSTSTRHLQDQILDKDLPLMARALGRRSPRRGSRASPNTCACGAFRRCVRKRFPEARLLPPL